MFDHVTIRASDRGASERFFETVLDAVGIAGTHSNEHVAAWQDFGVRPTDGTRPVTHGLHVAFAVLSRDHVDRFWQAGTRAGYRDDGEPGPRPEYGDDYDGGFLLDP
ncbi:MAG TPA: VOC family protein, partial [Gaiellales bacterium]|nr:VOC family protein [Gaiellales bacterium]